MPGLLDLRFQVSQAGLIAPDVGVELRNALPKLSIGGFDGVPAGVQIKLRHLILQLIAFSGVQGNNQSHTSGQVGPHFPERLVGIRFYTPRSR